jgi:hypothetical protein
MIPKEEDIGKEFGGGKFMALSSIGGKTYGKRIIIDEYYTELFEKRKAAETAPPQEKQTDQLSLLAAVADIVTKLKGDSNEETKLGGMFKGMMDTFTDGMGRMQKAMMSQQIESIKAMGDKAEPKTDNSELIQGVLNMVQNFGEIFIQSKGKQAEAMRALIENDEKYKAAVETEGVIEEIFEAGSKAEGIGKEKGAALFSKLDIIDLEDDPAVQEVQATGAPDPGGVGGAAPSGAAEPVGIK